MADRSEVLDVTVQVAAVLEQLDIPYLVGGSLASSLHGIPRATQDVDLVAMLAPAHAQLLVSALEQDFYIDLDMIQSAIRRRSSFNLIHLQTLFKVDVFVHQPDVLGQEQMKRRQRYTLEGSPGRSLVVASPEDVILQKLRWYQMGNRVSERQWRDVLGVFRVCRAVLDVEYLQRVARQAELGDLLGEALEAAENEQEVRL